MARRAGRREPRAHWVLLCLFTLVLLGELCLNGYVLHVGAEGSGPVAKVGAGGVAPASVTEGGPVQRVAADGTVTTRTMPAKTIALTFDDGPDAKWTPRVLDVLARYRAHGTCFTIGSQVNLHPDIARRALAEGHELGAHTFTHVDLAATPAWQRDIELTLTGNAIAAATGRIPVLLRPPYSAEPDAVSGAAYQAMRQAGRAGYLIVLADLDTEDWRRPGVPVHHGVRGPRPAPAAPGHLGTAAARPRPAVGPARRRRPGPADDLPHVRGGRAGRDPAGRPGAVRPGARPPGPAAGPRAAALPGAGLGHRAGVQRGRQHRGDRALTGGQRLPPAGGDRRGRRVQRRHRRHRGAAAPARGVRHPAGQRRQAGRAEHRHPVRPRRRARPGGRGHRLRARRRGRARPATGRPPGRGGVRQHEGG